MANTYTMAKSDIITSPRSPSHLTPPLPAPPADPAGLPDCVRAEAVLSAAGQRAGLAVAHHRSAARHHDVLPRLHHREAGRGRRVTRRTDGDGGRQRRPARATQAGSAGS